ncbi:MAG: hypothetical protein ACNA8W_13550 [Bradymonadaceae bacterium]
MVAPCAKYRARKYAVALFLTLLAAPGCATVPESSSSEPTNQRTQYLIMAGTSGERLEFIPISPDEPEPMQDEEDGGYVGPLSWHVTPFDEVVTTDIEDRTLRNRDVSGAHCYFAAKPNKDTPIFALFVRHTAHRGDVLYLGRHNMPLTRLDTVPLTDRRSSPIAVDLSELYCLYRDDQNEAGVIVFGFRYVDRPDDEIKYAAAWVEAPNARQPTDRTMTVPDPSFSTRIVGNPTVLVRVEEYLPPETRIIGSYADRTEAKYAAEPHIPRGRFRLRPENTYPYMTWQTYLGGKDDEFCPVNTECREREFDFAGTEEAKEEQD